MSVPAVDIGSECARPVAAGFTPLDGVGAAGAQCSCTATSMASPAGEVIVVRVAGEVDLLTISYLRDALADSVARDPCDVIVDLSAMTFCDVRGMAALVEAGATAAGRGIAYGVAAAPALVNRVWPLLWPEGELPRRFPNAAVGVLSAMARQAMDGQVWAPKRGPGWVRRWPADRPTAAAGEGLVVDRQPGPLGRSG